MESWRSQGSDAEASANDLFSFREKEALARKRSEVERARRSTADATVSTAVKVELATQLGLPATATFDEVIVCSWYQTNSSGNRITTSLQNNLSELDISRPPETRKESIGTSVDKKQSTYYAFVVDRQPVSSPPGGCTQRRLATSVATVTSVT